MTFCFEEVFFYITCLWNSVSTRAYLVNRC